MKTPVQKGKHFYKSYGYESPNWCCYYYFIDWYHIQLGLHIHLGLPNLEIHLPFGFIRVGRVKQLKRKRK